MDIGRHIPSGHDDGGYKRRSELIKQYILENLTADLHAAAVAEKFEMSLSTFLHIFRKYEQKTFQQYVEDTRMQTAMNIIRRGGRIKEAMHATGYHHRSTFNKAFKKIFKHPPTSFRFK